MIKLTQNELEALRAIDKSEYGEHLQDAVWSFTIVDNSSLKTRSVPGIVASLNKKGLVVSSMYEEGQATVEMTDLGVKTYTETLAALGEKPKKHS
jgi:translation initiation factor 6 (eIF-6)